MQLKVKRPLTSEQRRAQDAAKLAQYQTYNNVGVLVALALFATFMFVTGWLYMIQTGGAN